MTEPQGSRAKKILDGAPKARVNWLAKSIGLSRCIRPAVLGKRLIAPSLPAIRYQNCEIDSVCAESVRSFLCRNQNYAEIQASRRR